MTMTIKHWTLASIIAAALVLALMILGGGYRALGLLLLPVGLWLGLKREPEQAEIRPATRLLGWLFVGLAALAVIAAALAIGASR